MNRRYEGAILPDSITGMIFAMDGIKNAIVLLNGPMGCKFYHSTTSQYLMMRPTMKLPGDEGGQPVPVDYNYLNDWFFRQQQVPCTYLDGYDYIYGSKEKVREGLLFFKENIRFDFVAVINSPGAALIGDQLEGAVKEVLGEEVPCLLIESPGYSRSFQEGYSAASTALLSRILKGSLYEPGALSHLESEHTKSETFWINVLGMSIFDRYQEGDREELERLLDLFHIKVNCFCCTDCSMDQIRQIPEADLNLVLYPETGLESAQFLEEALGMPYVLLDCPPVGYQASRQMLESICQELKVIKGGKSVDISEKKEQKFEQKLRQAAVKKGRKIGKKEGAKKVVQDKNPFTILEAETEKSQPADIPALREGMAVFREEEERARARAWSKINDIYQTTGRPKGVSFAIQGSSSAVYAYAKFFIEYLGMIPDALSLVRDDQNGRILSQGEDLTSLTLSDQTWKSESEKGLYQLLHEHGYEDALTQDIYDTDAELVLADANVIAILKTKKKVFSGIEISNPGMGYVDLVKKTHFGIQGALFLTEQVLNGLMSRI